MRKFNILITGGSGSLGQKLILELLELNEVEKIVNIDTERGRIESPKLINYSLDVRDKSLSNILSQNKIHVVYHLVAIIGSKNISEEEIYSIEIDGLKNLLIACKSNQVKHFIFTSSGSVYGYQPNLPEYIKEGFPLYDKHVIQYGANKVLAEKVINEFNNTSDINFSTFRICSILGENYNNPISRWFKKGKIRGVKGYMSNFSFVWDEDVVGVLKETVLNKRYGIFNISGDGYISLKEIAATLNKPYRGINDALIYRILRLLKRFSISEYKPEHLNFLKYRPVLNNNKYKQFFDYSIKKTSKQAFKFFMINSKNKF
jgi:UDP-glucose 4-epimerase